MQDEFQLITKGLKTKTVSELTDKLIAEGWRFVRFLKNSEVDLPEFLALEEERKLQELEESVDAKAKIIEPYSKYSDFVEETDNGSRWSDKIDIY